MSIQTTNIQNEKIDIEKIQKVTWITNERNELTFKNLSSSEQYLLYLEGGDITPLIELCPLIQNCKLYIPYLPHSLANYSFYSLLNSKLQDRKIKLYTLSDIAGIETFKGSSENRDSVSVSVSIFTMTPTIDQYISEHSAVLYLNDREALKYAKHSSKKCYTSNMYSLGKADYKNLITIDSSLKLAFKDFTCVKKVCICVSELHSKNIQGINNATKDLKDSYGVGTVDVLAIHTHIHGIRDFQEKLIYNYVSQMPGQYLAFDKLATTNSTGIHGVQNSSRLQVIDSLELLAHSNVDTRTAQ